jgi:hypothetical protein
MASTSAAAAAARQPTRSSDRALRLKLGDELRPAGLARAFSRVGDMGLSAQVAHEEGTPIPTFISGGKLHIVAEARDAEAPINRDMQTLFEAERLGASAASGTQHMVRAANGRLLAMRDDEAEDGR